MSGKLKRYYPRQLLIRKYKYVHIWPEQNLLLNSLYDIKPIQKNRAIEKLDQDINLPTSSNSDPNREIISIHKQSTRRGWHKNSINKKKL